MATKNRDNLSFRVSPEIYSALQSDVFDKGFDSISEAARVRLESSLAIEGVIIEGARSGTSLLRDAKLKADVEERELKNAIASGKVTSNDDAADELEKRMTPVRQAIQQVHNAVDGLTPEQSAQLEKWKEDTMTNLSGGGFG